MSKLRPTLVTSRDGSPCMRNGTAYLMILNAVESRSGLIHGQLEAKGEYCSIGSYFHVNKGTALPEALIDEVAAVNDSMPTLTPIVRRKRMIQWLKWKLADLGMSRYHKRKV